MTLSSHVGTRDGDLAKWPQSSHLYKHEAALNDFEGPVAFHDCVNICFRKLLCRFMEPKSYVKAAKQAANM